MQDDDRADYARNGFALVRGAVTGPLLAALGQAVDAVQAAVPGLAPGLRERLTLERDLTEDRRDGIAASEVGDAIFILGDPPAFAPVFGALLDHPAVTGPIRAALGVSEAVAHFMNVTIKHPGFGRSIGWHRDYPNGYACPEASCFLRAMICLDGMTEAGGATAFLPGSHALTDAAARAAPRRPAGWSPEGTVTLPCAPGDMVLIHPKVLHGGGMNRSARPRRNIILQAGDAAVALRERPAQEAVAGRRLGGLAPAPPAGQ